MGNARRWTLDEFVKRYEDECSKEFRVSADWVYNSFYENIEPYMHLITKYQNLDNPITISELITVFGVSISTFKASRYYFKELDMLVRHKRDIMKIKSEMDLQRGIKLSPSNPKLIEMEHRLYNEEWKDKQSDNVVNLPETLTVNIELGEMSEEDLLPFDPKELKQEE